MRSMVEGASDSTLSLSSQEYSLKPAPLPPRYAKADALRRRDFKYGGYRPPMRPSPLSRGGTENALRSRVLPRLYNRPRIEILNHRRLA